MKLISILLQLQIAIGVLIHFHEGFYRVQRKNEKKIFVEQNYAQSNTKKKYSFILLTNNKCSNN